MPATDNVQGDTPLHEACVGCNTQIIDLLLARGADPEARNNEGLSPLEVISDKTVGAVDAKTLFTKLLPISARKYIPRIPTKPPKCLSDKVKSCEAFKVYVRYYLRGEGVSWATSTSIHQLIYNGNNELKKIEENFRTYLNQLPEENKPTNTTDVWRWIHFPANNASPQSCLRYSRVPTHMC